MDTGRGTHAEFLANLSDGGGFLMLFTIMLNVIQYSSLSCCYRHWYLLGFFPNLPEHYRISANTCPARLAHADQILFRCGKCPTDPRHSPEPHSRNLY